MISTDDTSNDSVKISIQACCDVDLLLRLPSDWPGTDLYPASVQEFLWNINRLCSQILNRILPKRVKLGNSAVTTINQINNQFQNRSSLKRTLQDDHESKSAQLESQEFQIDQSHGLNLPLGQEAP